ncbi:MAG: hypothetical protein JNN17_05725 [Verrucomicrobiaceae bacterium]|nr:hypothetical protein [Verrucomicrobiaceae bacterium]
MSLPETNKPTVQGIKTKIWITMALGAIFCAVPFVGFIMWVLFIPVVIMTGRWSYSLIGLGETKKAILHLIATVLFIPLAFVVPIISTSLASDLIWPSATTQPQSSSGSSSPSSPTKDIQQSDQGSISAEATKRTWSKFVMVLGALGDFNNTNTMLSLEGKSHLSATGTLDVAIECFDTVAKIKTEGADPELAIFMKSFSEEGVDVFAKMKNLVILGANVQGNVSQEDAASYVQALKSLTVRMAVMDQQVNQMHSKLNEKYGGGFDSPPKKQS